MISRIVGVFKLDANTFEEIEHDPSATSQAFIIVLVVALLSGIGRAGSAALRAAGTAGSDGSALLGGTNSALTAFGVAVLITFIGWVVWSLLTFAIGTILFGGQATIGEMLRVIGFAFAPQLLGIIPCFGSLVGTLWTLVAGFVAVRQGLDLDNTRAGITVAIGAVVYFIGLAIVGVAIGGASGLLAGN